MTETIRSAPFVDLDVATLYDILRLRSNVFVVEQNCVYLDLDGFDSKPDTVHWWTRSGDELVATLRVLADPEGTRIGRVVTDPSARGRGIGGRLVLAALDTVDGPVVIDAQSHLADWYSGFGFELDGPEFIEDGIPHVPMRRP